MGAAFFRLRSDLLSDRVVPFHGGKAVQSPEPQPDIVAALRDLMERAKTGDLQTLAYAAMEADEQCMSEVVGRVDGFGILGALAMTRRDLEEAVAESLEP